MLSLRVLSLTKGRSLPKGRSVTCNAVGMRGKEILRYVRTNNAQESYLSRTIFMVW